MDVGFRACALLPLSVRAVISLPLSFTRSRRESLYLPFSLSLGKTQAGGEQLKEEEADSAFFFFYTVAVAGYLEKEFPPETPPSLRRRCGAAQEEKIRMCLRKRSGFRPPDLINAKIVSI